MRRQRGRRRGKKDYRALASSTRDASEALNYNQTNPLIKMEEMSSLISIKSYYISYIYQQCYHEPYMSNNQTLRDFASLQAMSHSSSEILISSSFSRINLRSCADIFLNHRQNFLFFFLKKKKDASVSKSCSSRFEELTSDRREVSF